MCSEESLSLARNYNGNKSFLSVTILGTPF